MRGGGGGGVYQCFFFYVTIFGLPVTLLEKVHVILQKVPMTKTPNFARDKIAKKLPVKN